MSGKGSLPISRSSHLAVSFFTWSFALSPLLGGICVHPNDGLKEYLFHLRQAWRVNVFNWGYLTEGSVTLRHLYHQTVHPRTDEWLIKDVNPESPYSFQQVTTLKSLILPSNCLYSVNHGKGFVNLMVFFFLWVLWASFHSCFSLEEEIHTHVLDLFCLYPSFCKIVDSIRPSFCDFVAPYLTSKDLNRLFPELGLHQIHFFFLGWESVSNETIGQSQWGLQNQEGQP